MKKILLLAIALWAAGAARAQKTDTAEAAGAVAALRTENLASRTPGTAGSRRAQYFLMNRFRSLGVLSFWGSYEQPFFFPADGRRIMGTNILGYIKGTQDGWIIVGARYDHPVLGAAPLDTVDPRLRDNVSGVSVLLALAAYFQAHPPAHSVLLVAFDAEEEGMQGARAFVAQSAEVVKKARLFINLDGAGDDSVLEVYGTDRSPALRPLVSAVADSVTGLRVELPADASGGWLKKGDQLAFADTGVPLLYLTSPGHGRASGKPSFVFPAARFAEGLVSRLDTNLTIRLPGKNKWIMQKP